MKLITICFWLLSEAYAMPTQPPTVDSKVSCCGPESQLVFHGHAAKQGFNVLVFEFTPENPTPKVAEENEMYGSTVYETEKPTNVFEHRNPYDMDGFNGNGKGGLAETAIETNTMLPADYHSGNWNNAKNRSDKIQSTTQTEYPQNDSGLSLSDIFKLYGGLPGSTVDPYTTDSNATNEKGDLDDMFNTEGSALTDMPGYNETHGVTEIPTVHFHPTQTDIDRAIGCSGHGKVCNDTATLTPEISDRQDSYATGEKSMANPSTVGGREAGTISTKKKNNKMDSIGGNKKSTVKKPTTTKREELDNGHKRNGKTRDAQKESKKNKFRRGHRVLDSSSESDSESDQRFD